MNLQNEIPAIRRARGFRLYTEENRRLMDLWRDGGGAIAGHRRGSAVLKMKNALEKGLMAAYPGKETARLKRALTDYCPGWNRFRIFPTLDEAKRQLRELNLNAEILRPLSGKPSSVAEELIIQLPMPGSATPAAVAIREGAPQPEGWPASDEPVSSFLLAAATRALYDWIAFEPQAAAFDFSWFDAAREAHGEENCLFERQGARLHYRGAVEDYPAVFRRVLEGGALISPVPDEPSLMPFELSEGEKALLIRLLLSTQSQANSLD